MTCVPLVFFLTIIVTIHCSDDIAFLKGVYRLGHNSYNDNYFSCNLVSNELQWRINGVRTDIYIAGSVAQIYTNTTPNFNYTITLLSSRLTPLGLYTFDSVLIVSCYDECNLNIICTNGQSLIGPVTNLNRRSNVLEKTNKPNALFEYILTQSNIITEPKNTSIFICGVNHNYMTWNIYGNTYTFFASESIGLDKKRFPELDASVVNYQAILIGKFPYRIVAVMFVNHNSKVNITCGFDQITLHLSTRQTVTTTTDTPIYTSYNQFEETKRTTLIPITAEIKEEHEMINITALIIAVTITVVIVFVGGPLACLCLCGIFIKGIRASGGRKTDKEKETTCCDCDLNCRSLHKALMDCCCMKTVTIATDCTTQSAQRIPMRKYNKQKRSNSVHVRTAEEEPANTEDTDEHEMGTAEEEPANTEDTDEHEMGGQAELPGAPSTPSAANVNNSRGQAGLQGAPSVPSTTNAIIVSRGQAELPGAPSTPSAANVNNSSGTGGLQNATPTTGTGNNARQPVGLQGAPCAPSSTGVVNNSRQPVGLQGAPSAPSATNAVNNSRGPVGPQGTPSSPPTTDVVNYSRALTSIDAAQNLVKPDIHVEAFEPSYLAACNNLVVKKTKTTEELTIFPTESSTQLSAPIDEIVSFIDNGHHSSATDGQQTSQRALPAAGVTIYTGKMFTPATILEDEDDLD